VKWKRDITDSDFFEWFMFVSAKKVAVILEDELLMGLGNNFFDGCNHKVEYMNRNHDVVQKIFDLILMYLKTGRLVA
jgi:hypothetical protein